MRFVYLRLFLTEVEQPPILVETGDIASRLPREEFLSEIFNSRWSFDHRGTALVYVPVQRSEDDNAQFVFGRIGRRYTSYENAGPEDRFEETEHSGWKAANLIVNLSTDPEGQKVAIQDRGDVGKPLAIANSLIQHVNEVRQDSGWLVSVNAMIEKKTFWEAVETHKGEITRAEFNYVTPNVLGIRSKLNERLKEYREKENAQSVSVILNEPKGNLKLDSEEVSDAVDYASEGGGSIKLKSGRSVIFDSEDTEKAKDAEADDVTRFDTPSGRRDLISRFFG